MKKNNTNYTVRILTVSAVFLFSVFFFKHSYAAAYYDSSFGTAGGYEVVAQSGQAGMQYVQYTSYQPFQNNYSGGHVFVELISSSSFACGINGSESGGCQTFVTHSSAIANDGSNYYSNIIDTPSIVSMTTSTYAGGFIYFLEYATTTSFTAGDYWSIQNNFCNTAGCGLSLNGNGVEASTGTLVSAQGSGTSFLWTGAVVACVTNDPTFSDCSGSPPAPSSTIYFSYPTNGIVTPPFDNFYVNVTGVDTSTLYGIRIDYYWPQIELLINAQVETTGGLGQSLLHQGRLVPYYDPSGITQYFTYTTNITANAIAYLWNANTCTNANGTGCTILASSSITFQQIPSQNSPLATSTYLHIQPTVPTSTVSSTTGIPIITTSTNPYPALSDNASSTQNYCSQFAGGSLVDWGPGIAYGFCSAMNLAFNPNAVSFAPSFFKDQLTNLETAPPFSPFFDTLNAVSSSLNSFQNSTSNDVTIGYLGFPDQQQETLIDINSTTYFSGGGRASTTQSEETSNFDEGYIEVFLWTLAAGKVIWIWTHNTT